jgi:hypothetical protein
MLGALRNKATTAKTVVAFYYCRQSGLVSALRLTHSLLPQQRQHTLRQLVGLRHFCRLG